MKHGIFSRTAWIRDSWIESGVVEDLVQIRDDLLRLGETEKLLDILIQTRRGVKHRIFSRTYQWYLAGVEVCIKQERVDENFLPLRWRARAGVAHPAAAVQP